MTQELQVPETGSTVELTLDNAILGVREVRTVNKGASFCPACGLALATPDGWRLEVQGSDAAEVQRVALALLQETARVQPKGDVVHGNKYVVEGPAGAVGDNASGSIINTWNTFVQHADQAELSRQLALLRSRLDPSELDQAAVLGAIANAEQSINAADGAGVLAWLRKAGKRGLELAQEVGVSLVTEALKAAMGLG